MKCTPKPERWGVWLSKFSINEQRVIMLDDSTTLNNLRAAISRHQKQNNSKFTTQTNKTSVTIVRLL